MTWGMVQVLQVALLVAIAIPTHVVMGRLRRSFLGDLERLAGGVIRSFATVSEIVSALIYLAFAAALLPFDAVSTLDALGIESLLDKVAIFAVLVAAVQVVSLMSLFRVANSLDPWPPRDDVAVSTS